MSRIAVAIAALFLASVAALANMPGTFSELLLTKTVLPTVAYVTSATTSGSGATATYTSTSIGTASNDRLVVVGATCDSAAGVANQITSITIDGNSATIHENPSGGRAPTAIASLLVTSGTTATIVVTASASCNRQSIDVWNLTNYLSATPYSVSGGQNLSTTGTSVAVTLDLPDNGAALFVAQRRGSSETMNWSSATEDSQYGLFNNRITAAHKTTSNSISSHTETVSWTTTNITRGLSGVSWR